MSLACTACGLQVCGCCHGISAETPLAIDNRPGLAEIAYRIGTHSRFKESLLAGLSASSNEQLRRLNPRDGDPTIGLLDAFALMADVLTFYSERIANEQYLRTATELGSVRELVRLIGYRPAPGVAASSVLAFTLERGPGAPERVVLPAGIPVQSIPGPGELPQTFETIEQIEARASWNSLAPEQSQAWPLGGKTELWLSGAANEFSPGDTLLFLPPSLALSGATVREVRAVVIDRARAVTRLTWDGALDAGEYVAFVLRARLALFGHNAPDYRVLPEDVRANFEGTATPAIPAPSTWPSYSVHDVAGTSLGEDNIVLHLEGQHPQLVASGFAVLAANDSRAVYRISEVGADARQGFALAGKTTRLTVSGGDLDAFDEHLRDTLVLADSRPLLLTERPVSEPIPALTADIFSGRRVVLSERVAELAPGRTLVIRGPRARVRTTQAVPAAQFADLGLFAGEELEVLARAVSGSGYRWTLRNSTGTEADLDDPAGDQLQVVNAAPGAEVVSEVVIVQSVTDGVRTTLEMTSDFQHVYDRALTRLAGNIAAATHGQRVSEVLGSGNSAVPWQRFALASGPLTFVASANAERGIASTLEVRVNGVRWAPVDAFFGRGPRERIYVAETDAQGNTSVRFGDGVTGARPPTGRDNITAVYRKGIGRGGQVGVDKLALLLQRPLGVQSVTNPLPASGAEDPDGVDAARSAAPLTVVTLGRIVALDDYAAFARDFAGIAQAHAEWTWSTDRRGVIVSVAGVDGDEVDAPSRAKLLQAMLGSVPSVALPGVAQPLPLTPIDVQSYRPVAFHLRARVKTDPDFLPDDVLARVEARLRSAFSFDARRFGQSVVRSEVIAQIQAVQGVVGVDLDALHTGGESTLEEFLRAEVPKPGVDAELALSAQLLTLSSDPMRGPGAELSALWEWS